MNRKLIISILVIVIVGLLGFWLYRKANPEELVLEKVAGQNIAGASMEGEVLSINKEAKSIVIKAATVERTSRGNELVYYDKTIIFEDKVTFVDKLAKRTSITTQELSAAEVLGKIRIGDRISISGNSANGFFVKTEAFKAEKVEIMVKMPDIN